MLSVSIHEAKTHLSSLVDAVERSGEKIIIKKHGKAVAEITRITVASRLQTNSLLKDITINYDPIEPTQSEWEHV